MPTAKSRDACTACVGLGPGGKTPCSCVRGEQLSAQTGAGSESPTWPPVPPRGAFQVQPSPGRRPAQAPGARCHQALHRVQEPGPRGLAARRGRVAGQLPVGTGRGEGAGRAQGGGSASPSGAEGAGRKRARTSACGSVPGRVEARMPAGACGAVGHTRLPVSRAAPSGRVAGACKGGRDGDQHVLGTSRVQKPRLPLFLTLLLTGANYLHFRDGKIEAGLSDFPMRSHDWKRLNWGLKFQLLDLPGMDGRTVTAELGPAFRGAWRLLSVCPSGCG